MDTNWLRVFREIAVTGSFTAAAKTLGYTQSAVSRQIAALETDLGATLFARRARGVRLTEAGRYLLRHSESVLDRLDDARRELTGLRDLTLGRLRLGGFPTGGVALMPAAIAAWRADHPDIALSYQDGLTRDLVDDLRHDVLDLALIAGYPDQIADLPALRLTHLWDEPVLVGLPHDHPLSGQDVLRLSELADESWIAGSASPRETLIRATLRQGFAPRIGYVVKEWNAKLGFVAAGLGVTLLPALALPGVRTDIAVVPLHPDDTPFRGIHAAAPPAGSALASRFTEYLTDQVTRLPFGTPVAP